MESKFEDRMESENKCHQRIVNANLTCRDCVYAYDDTHPEKNYTMENGIQYAPTSMCEMYNVKPNKVLLGGECDKKKAK